MKRSLFISALFSICIGCANSDKYSQATSSAMKQEGINPDSHLLRKGDVKPDSQVVIKPVVPIIPSSSSIEELSNYLFYYGFNNVKQDSLLNRMFDIKVEIVESEGVEWREYKFRKEEKLMFTAENSWQDSLNIHRITYYASSFFTKNGLHPGIAFKEIKNYIDTNRLNAAPDGDLFFYDTENKSLIYGFDISGIPSLFYGVNGLKDVPDGLRVESIVTFNIVRE